MEGIAGFIMEKYKYKKKMLSHATNVAQKETLVFLGFLLLSFHSYYLDWLFVLDDLREVHRVLPEHNSHKNLQSSIMGLL